MKPKRSTSTLSRISSDQLTQTNTLLWTLEFMDNLAMQFFGLGQYFEAEAIYREQASQRERLLSARHPKTLASTIGIANCLHLQSKSRHATEIGQHVLTLLKEVLGDNHPSTLTVMANLTWYECNNLSLHDFVSKMTEVHRLRQAELGDDNLDTVKSSLYIAWGQCQCGKFQEAQEIFDSTHAHLIKIHGSENHLDIINWFLWKAEACVVNGQDYEAERLRRKAHKLMGKTFGERHPSTLLSAKHLINSISRLGRHNEAEEMASKMISMISDILGSQHPRTTEFVQIIAEINIEQGKWAKAESLYAKVLKAYEPYGEQHPYVIFAKANLAKALSWQGQFPEAEKLLQSALDGAKHALDYENSDFVSLLAFAVGVKRAQVKYSDAEELCRQTLRARGEVLGEKHRGTLASMNYLALVLRDQGKYGDSEELYRQTLRAREEVLGQKHPDALTSMNDLALVLQDQGKYSNSEELYQQTLRRSEEVLGQKHPDTLTSMNNLAWVLQDQGKYIDAEELYWQTLGKREDVLGKRHPDTFRSLSGIAVTLRCQCNYEAAEALQKQALTGLKEVLGADHRDTIASMHSLSVALWYRCKYSEGQKLVLEVLEKRRVLGEEHPDFLTSIGTLAAMLQAQGQFDEAERLFRVELKGLEKVLGKEHPETRRSLGNLTDARRAKQSSD